MKKIIVTISVMLACHGWMTTTAYAQSEANFSKKGRLLIESGYNSFFGFLGGSSGSTILFTEEEAIVNLGIDGGYFLSENLALKIRFGLLSSGGTSLINISGGGKYYIAGKIPVEVGAGIVTIGGGRSFLGNASLGYGVRLAQNINLEPSVGLLFSNGGTPLTKLGVNFVMFL